METSRKAIAPVRFCCLIGGGIVIGFIAYFAIGFSLDRRFEARAVVASDEVAGPEVRLARIHAEMIYRNLKLASYETVETIQETRFRVSSRGVEVIALANNPVVAKEIAVEAANLFRGMEHERKLADYQGKIGDFTEADLVLLEDSKKLASLLNTQAHEFDFVHFLEIPALSKKDDPAAQRLMADEDFSRRFNRFSEIAMKLGLLDAPGEPISAPPELLIEPQLPDRPVSASLLVPIAAGCQIGGLILGLIAAFLFGRTTIAALPPALPSIRIPATPAPSPESPEDW